MRKIMNSLRILSIVMFGLSFYVIISNVSPDVWEVDRALNVGKLILVLLWILSVLISVLAGQGDLNSPVTITIYGSIWNGIFGQETTPTDPRALLGELFPATAEMTPGRLFIASLVSFALFVVVPLAIIASIGFLRNCDTKLATMAFICLQLVLIVGFLTDSYIDTIDDSFLQYSSKSIIDLLSSPLFQAGLLTYLYLEISFSAAYSYRIIDPLVGRRRRITSHIKQVREYVPKREEAAPDITRMPTSSRGAKFSMEAITYLREALERRIFKRGEEEYRVNQRLKTYFETLVTQNPDAEQTLTAESVSPKALRIAAAIVPNLIIRMVVVVIIAWVLLNPSRLMKLFILIPNNAQPLLQSLEISQPEILLSILAPVVIGFFILGILLSWIRDKLLVQRQEAEEILMTPSKSKESTQVLPKS
ncbi:MAG: hypothetical protein ACE5R6_14685 [Candidatus Heimdallarchaeota archaeon]